MKNYIIIVSGLLIIAIAIGTMWWKFTQKNFSVGTIIILNGPSGSGKSSIQKEFQKLMMPNLWLKIGIDGFFDMVMPEITVENMQYWQEKNPIRWITESIDSHNNNIITLHVGDQGDGVAYAMNSAIVAYAQQGCNIIVDYIAYDQKWFADLQKKCTGFKTYYVAVEIPLELLESREEARGTSPKGHARSHYFTVYGDEKYDLVVNSQKNTAQEIALQIKQLIEK